MFKLVNKHRNQPVTLSNYGLLEMSDGQETTFKALVHQQGLNLGGVVLHHGLVSVVEQK